MNIFRMTEKQLKGYRKELDAKLDNCEGMEYQETMKEITQVNGLIREFEWEKAIFQ